MCVCACLCLRVLLWQWRGSTGSHLIQVKPHKLKGTAAVNTPTAITHSATVRSPNSSRRGGEGRFLFSCPGSWRKRPFFSPLAVHVCLCLYVCVRVHVRTNTCLLHKQKVRVRVLLLRTIKDHKTGRADVLCYL